MLPFAVTIFTGAFLLFQVQPLIAKYILPWFGGSSAVWTTSMFFFQAFLLAGYAYAHMSVRYLKPRAQVVLHLVLLLVATTQLPVTPSDAWKPASGDAGARHILLLLTANLGLPYLALSSTTPLMQAWFSRTHPGVSPYRLYALSNVAALLALVSYPFVVEPALTRITQANVWAYGFVVFVFGGIACAIALWRRQGDDPTTLRYGSLDEERRPGWRPRLQWLGLSAGAVVLLLAITSAITQDLAPVPFLWILPLGLYLLSFILCFDREKLYARIVWMPALVLMTVAFMWVTVADEVSIVIQLSVYSTVLFVFCMVCHGELVRLKPHPRFLTGYYLTIALGGAAGGGLVAIAAPLVFSDYLELPIGLLAVCALALFALFADRKSVLAGGRPTWAWVGMIAIYLGLAFALDRVARQSSEPEVTKARNFYGVLTIYDEDPDTPLETRHLLNGVIQHGLQFAAPEKRSWATTYYGEDSGAGLAIRFSPRQQGKRVGIVGLGVGTLAAFAEEGDYFRFYEINPDVKTAAETYFSYLGDSPAEIDVVMGDARISMEREPPQAFDVLVLDAFTSDAIPVHLLTREAFETYLHHLTEDGVIAVHVSNRHVNLEPVVAALAGHFGLRSSLIVSEEGPGEVWEADWVLVTGNLDFLSQTEIIESTSEVVSDTGPVRLWTDDYASLFQVLVHW